MTNTNKVKVVSGLRTVMTALILTFVMGLAAFGFAGAGTKEKAAAAMPWGEPVFSLSQNSSAVYSTDLQYGEVFMYVTGYTVYFYVFEGVILPSEDIYDPIRYYYPTNYYYRVNLGVPEFPAINKSQLNLVSGHTYTVVMVLDFGTSFSVSQPVYLDYIEYVSLPPTPEREGYTFVGWYYDEALTVPYTGGSITAGTQFYAKFEINRCTVTFDTGFDVTVKPTVMDWGTIYADFKMSCVRNGFYVGSAYDIDGFSLGFANPYRETQFVPPYSYICLDEAQRYYNSREGRKLADWVSRWYETHRHWGLDICLVAQRPTLIDLNIRGIAERFIFIRALNVFKDAFGRVERTEWDCIEFDNCDAAETYSKTKKPDGVYKKTRYEYAGNIWACYNHRGMAPLHLAGRYESDFDLTVPLSVGYGIDEIRAYNRQHTYLVPEGFYKGQKAV